MSHDEKPEPPRRYYDEDMGNELPPPWRYSNPPRRLWRFYVDDFNEEDESVCLDATGYPVDPEDVDLWTGTKAEATEEAERRADMWEEREEGWLVGRVTSESLGIVEERGEGAR